MALQAVASIGLNLFGGLFGGAHKKAVAQENATLSSANPKAEADLQRLDMEMQGGLLSREQVRARLDQIESEFAETVQPIIKETGGKCNAACVFKKQLHDKVEVLRTKANVLAAVKQKSSGVVGGIVGSKWAKLALLFALPGVGIVGLGYILFRLLRRRR